jgi:hypothetical protein
MQKHKQKQKQKQKQKPKQKQQWLRMRLRYLDKGWNISQDTLSPWLWYRFVETSDIDFIGWTCWFDDKSRMSQRNSQLVEDKRR